MKIQMGQRRNQKGNFKNLEANEDRNIIQQSLQNVAKVIQSTKEKLVAINAYI